MAHNREFYPMITQTVKGLIGNIVAEDREKFLLILQNYPNIRVVDEKDMTALLLVLVSELDRQYTRWNKGGGNGK